MVASETAQLDLGGYSCSSDGRVFATDKLTDDQGTISETTSPWRMAIDSNGKPAAFLEPTMAQACLKTTVGEVNRYFTTSIASNLVPIETTIMGEYISKGEPQSIWGACGVKILSTQTQTISPTSATEQVVISIWRMTANVPSQVSSSHLTWREIYDRETLSASLVKNSSGQWQVAERTLQYLPGYGP
ncbi:MAG: hypothetical protein HKL80_03425 [Acidimicrobiales bacterium]|nr:hypothetical protein [Acidimicrobiales bacterium]